jgi:hypothetical protein
MANGAAERKVGVVTFNNDVTLIGDGTQFPEIITGDKLNNYDYLIENGKNKASKFLSKSVSQTAKTLTDKLLDI